MESLRALTELLFRAKFNWDMQSRNLQGYEIKLAEVPEEIQGASEVRNAVYVKETGWEHETDQDEHDGQSIFIIAKRSGTYVGCLRLILRGSAIDPNSIEISRLCILKEHRGDKSLIIGMYLTAQIILSTKFNADEAVFITKPALANSIGLVLGRITRLGTVKEHKGLRAPYRIRFKPPVSPGLRKIYETIQSSM